MLTISNSTRFLIATDTGDISPGGECGLYEEDTRCLSEYRLRCDGKALILLSARPIGDNASEHFLVNNEAEGLQQAVLAIVRRRTLERTLREELVCTNYGTDESRWTLDFSFDADFAGVGDVRQAAIQNQDAARRPGGFRTALQASRGLLHFRYEREGFRRELEINLPPEARNYGHNCRIQLCLQPHETRTFTLEFVPRTGPKIRRVEPLPLPAAEHRELASPRREVASPHRETVSPRRDVVSSLLDATSAHPEVAHPSPKDAPAQRPNTGAIVDAVFPANAPTLESDSRILCQAYQQSLTDFAALRLLGDAISGDAFVIAGGIPWYLALFGRDSLVACYQALPFTPEAARGILRTLAALQGDQVDDRRGEQPGKIPHEHRFGTITGTQSGIPAYPHYRSIDSTPLFIILLAAYHRLTGDLDLVRELWPRALRALNWMDEYGDRDGDGYLEYPGTQNGGISNQGWKDSSDAIRCRDGSIPHGDIALCEVQGYAYAARLGLADLAEALLGGAKRDADIPTDRESPPHAIDGSATPYRAPGGTTVHDHPNDDHASVSAGALRERADKLKDRLNHDFWLPDRDFYAQALAGSGGRKIRVDSLTSNPGQLLWTAIADQDKARAIADRFLAPDFFSGWGIRTMAASESAYNPVSYQSGSVWPHDNSLIAYGLARYGLTDQAAHLIEGLLQALSHATDRRLPELFTGFGTNETSAPVQYPMACRPQAWATGAIFLMISAMIGLDPAVGSRGVPGKRITRNTRGGTNDTGVTSDHYAPSAPSETPAYSNLQQVFPGEPFLPPSINYLHINGLYLQGRRITVTLNRADRGVDRQIQSA